MSTEAVSSNAAERKNSR